VAGQETYSLRIFIIDRILKWQNLTPLGMGFSPVLKKVLILRCRIKILCLPVSWNIRFIFHDFSLTVLG